MKFLTEEFLSQYTDTEQTEHKKALEILGEKYNIKDKSWKSIVVDIVERNIQLGGCRFFDNKYTTPNNKMQEEAEVLFDNMFHMRQFLYESSIRKRECETMNDETFINITKLSDLTSGVLYSIYKGDNFNIRCVNDCFGDGNAINRKIKIKHSMSNDKTEITDNKVTISVENDNFGLKHAIEILGIMITESKYSKLEQIHFAYRTDVNTAEKISTMINKMELALKGTIDERQMSNQDDIHKLNTLDIYDLVSIACDESEYNPHVSFTCSKDDMEILNVKSDITEDLEHRMMADIMVEFNDVPTQDELDKLTRCGVVRIVNKKHVEKQRPNGMGMSSLGEVILDSRGTCNMTYIDVSKFVKQKDGVALLDYTGLMQAQALSARAGLRKVAMQISNVDRRDMVIGCSLVNFDKASEILCYNEEQQANLLALLSDVAYKESVIYSHILRTPTPLLTTTVTSKFKDYDLHIDNFPYNIMICEYNGSKSAEEHLNDYFMYQTDYANHNTSTPIYYMKSEWEQTKQIIIDRWKEIMCLTLIPHTVEGGRY